MAVNKLNLERDGLVVGATQLVASGGGVTIGQNLAVAGSIFTANLSASGPVSIAGNLVISNIASSTSTTTGAFVVVGGVGVAGNLFLGGQLNITRSTNGDAFLVNSPGGSTPNFTVQGSGEQTFRLYNSAATGSTRTSIKLASRNNTDWEWIAYTDAAGTGANDLTIANQAGTALYIASNRTATFGGNLTSTTHLLSSTFTANTNITSYDFDHAGGTVSISNAQTINFPNFSGMIIINNHVSGSVATWLVGGGGITVLGATNSATGIGAITFVGGQYVWTSNANPAGLHTITTIRTRSAA
jgi:hypothetical protein